MHNQRERKDFGFVMYHEDKNNINITYVKSKKVVGIKF